MKKQFLDLTGLNTFLTQLKKLFATKEAVQEVKESTDPYIFEIDYSMLQFNTDLIITGDSSSPIIDVGQVGFMIISD